MTSGLNKKNSNERNFNIVELLFRHFWVRDTYIYTPYKKITCTYKFIILQMGTVLSSEKGGSRGALLYLYLIQFNVCSYLEYIHIFIYFFFFCRLYTREGSFLVL